MTTSVWPADRLALRVPDVTRCFAWPQKQVKQVIERAMRQPEKGNASGKIWNKNGRPSWRPSL